MQTKYEKTKSHIACQISVFLFTFFAIIHKKEIADTIVSDSKSNIGYKIISM